MTPEIVNQLDGYDNIIKEIEIAKRLSSDPFALKGEVQKYIDRLHPESLELTVSEIIDETTSAKTIRFISKKRQLPPFQAGQYINIFVDVDGVRTSRPYSISSSPNQLAYYDVTVRRVDDGFVSNYLLDEIKTGDLLKTSSPSGTFFYNPIIHDATIVGIVGGSGITPLMSMVREIAERRIDRNVFIFYGNKSDDDIIFHDELLEISEKFDNINYIPVLENSGNSYRGDKGFISMNLIKEKIGSLKDKTFFLCGPQGLYDAIIPDLKDSSVKLKKIRQEMYGLPKDIWNQPGWPSSVDKESTFKVTINNDGDTIEVSAVESLLNSLERNQKVVPALCRSGECSRCRLKLLSGKVYQPEGTRLRKSDAQSGYIHSCAAYPVEDIEILL